MMKKLVAPAALLLVLSTAPAALASPPPADALPLSEILRMVEQREDIAYFDEVEWDDDGYWEIEFVTPGGTKSKIRVDPLNGEQVRR